MKDSDIKLTVLVLDFKKEIETRKCLESIRDLCTVPHKTVLLDNGGVSNYAWQLFKDGLCDTLISKRESLGGGVGQTDLFRWCDTQYALFVQQDQILEYEISQGVFNWLTNHLHNGYRCVDLNGDQSNRLVWTDRAHLIETGFFNSTGPHPRGGTGPLHAEPWLEKYMQDVFSKPENKIFHVRNPIFFKDVGVWTIREQPDGSLSKLRTDTKQLWWITTPKEKYVYPELSDEEWKTSIDGNWIGGSIPEVYKQHSFNCWGDVKP